MKRARYTFQTDDSDIALMYAMAPEMIRTLRAVRTNDSINWEALDRAQTIVSRFPAGFQEIQPEPTAETTWTTLVGCLVWAVKEVETDPSLDPEWQAAVAHAKTLIFDSSKTNDDLVSALGWALDEIADRLMVQSNTAPAFLDAYDNAQRVHNEFKTKATR